MTEGVYVHLLDMHEVRRHEKLRLLHMNEGVICTSVEHVLGSHSRRQTRREKLSIMYLDYWTSPGGITR